MFCRLGALRRNAAFRQLSGVLTNCFTPVVRSIVDPIVLHFMIFMSGRLPLFGYDVDLERELEHDGHVELVGGSKHLLVQGVDVGLFAAALEFLRQPRHGSRDAFTVLTKFNVPLSVLSGDLEVSQSVGVVPIRKE